MTCRKCNADLPADAAYCHRCGTKQQITYTRHRRGNGQGNSYRRGDTWTARVVVGWKPGDPPKPIWRTKGGFATKKAALEHCVTMKQEGIVQPDVTLSALFDLWQEEYAPRVKQTTLAGYTAAFSHFASLHDKKIRELQATGLQAAINQCPAGKRTKQLMKVTASLLYKFAINNNLVEKNAAQYLYTGNDPTTTREAFTAQELEILRRAIPAEPYAAYVYAMCYTGFRPGEFLALKKESYHSDGQYLVGGGKTAAGTDRIVPVHAKILAIIQRQAALPDTAFLFPGKNGKAMSHEYFKKYIFTPLMDRLGITGKLPYSCRHTYANLLKDATGATKDKAALMGHTNYAMTQYYQSTDIDHLRAIVNQME